MNPERIEFGSRVPLHITDLLRNPPPDWENPAVKLERVAYNQPGMLPLISIMNPGFQKRINDFFLEDKSILIIGGESGMGKSLLSAEMQLMSEDLNYILPQQYRHNLNLVGWDRAHGIFFQEAGRRLGDNLDLPKGETDLSIRNLVSLEMRNIVRNIKQLGNNRTKLIVETPLIGNRGEIILQDLPEYRDKIQLFIMHSPEIRYETIEYGRKNNQSNHPIGMKGMRESMKEDFSLTYSGFSRDAWDAVIKAKMKEIFAPWDPMIVEIDPNWSRSRYEFSNQLYNERRIKQDRTLPSGLSEMLARDYKNMLQYFFETNPKRYDDILEKAKEN